MSLFWEDLGIANEHDFMEFIATLSEVDRYKLVQDYFIRMSAKLLKLKAKMSGIQEEAKID